MPRINEVISVSAQILKSNPVQIAIEAIGLVPTSGWRHAQLSPWVYITPPADGIYDFDFEAVPPQGIALQVISPIVTNEVFPNPPADLKGVRVHGILNSVSTLLGEPAQSKLAEIDFSAEPLGIFPWPGVDNRGPSL